MDTSPHQSDYVNINGINLHYLDWGGQGDVLLFLTGMGLSAHVYDKFAPRFTDHFHVLAVTRRGHGDSDYPESGYDADTLTEDLHQFMDALRIDRAILVGHSMANVELCHFTQLHPQRVEKVVFLDAAFDRTAPAFAQMMELNPLMHIEIPDTMNSCYSIGEYIEAVKRSMPSLAAVWGEVMDEEATHSVMFDHEGKVIDKMSENISKALFATLKQYQSEYENMKMPVLAIFAIQDGAYFISPEYMTGEQKAEVIEFYDSVRASLTRECMDQFHQSVPQAEIVEIPKGHHYCFIKQEDLVFDYMSSFLLQ